MVLFWVGCSAPTFVEWPSFGPDARSGVVAYEDGAQLRVMAFDFDQEEPISFSLDSDSAFRITALGFSKPLSELGLTPGVVAPNTTGACLPGSLPPADVALEWTKQNPSWQPAGTLPDSLLDFRTQFPCPCRAFEVVRTLGLGPRSGTSVGFVTSKSWLFYLSSLGSYRISLLDPSRAELIEPNPIAPGDVQIDAISDGGGQIWVASKDRILRWASDTSSTSAELVASITGGDNTFRGIGGGLSPTGLELLVSGQFDDGVDSGARVWALEGTNIVPVASKSKQTALGGIKQQEGLVAWRSRGEALISLHDLTDLAWLESGRITIRPAPEGLADVTSVLVSKDLGYVAGTALGNVVRFEGLSARRLRSKDTDSEPESPVYGLTEISDGIAFVTEDGRIGSVHSGDWRCPSVTIRQLAGGKRVLARDDVVFVLGTGHDDQAVVVVLKWR